jgi:putative SOS response-associated peptidase YedK
MMERLKPNPIEGRHLLYGFLTTEPNDIVAPIHPKAMPGAPWAEACTLQRPLPDGVLKIIASGQREDPPPERNEAVQDVEPLLPL